jgi:uncharacterized protein YoxC
MSAFPCWWLTLSGVYFGMMILVGFVMLILLIKLGMVIKKASAELSLLNQKTHRIADETENLLKQANGIVEDVSDHVKETANNVSSATALIVQYAEKGLTFLLTATLFKKLITSFWPNAKNKSDD